MQKVNDNIYEKIRIDMETILAANGGSYVISTEDSYDDMPELKEID